MKAKLKDITTSIHRDRSSNLREKPKLQWSNSELSNRSVRSVKSVRSNWSSKSNWS